MGKPGSGHTDDIRFRQRQKPIRLKRNPFTIWRPLGPIDSFRQRFNQSISRFLDLFAFSIPVEPTLRPPASSPPLCRFPVNRYAPSFRVDPSRGQSLPQPELRRFAETTRNRGCGAVFLLSVCSRCHLSALYRAIPLYQPRICKRSVLYPVTIEVCEKTHRP